MPVRRINADKPLRWKADIAASVDQFNQWFMQFAPQAFRSTRVKTTERVKAALLATRDLRDIGAATLRANPSALPTLRMCTAPPLAVDRLVGLADANKSFIGSMEEGRLAARMKSELIDENLSKICRVIAKLLDHDIFPWLEAGKEPTAEERDRASTIVADRLTRASHTDDMRMARREYELEVVSAFLESAGFRRARPHGGASTSICRGTYAFDVALPAVGRSMSMPVDVLIQCDRSARTRRALALNVISPEDSREARRKVARAIICARRVEMTYGQALEFAVILCRRPDAQSLGSLAAERIDWVWLHEIEQLLDGNRALVRAATGMEWTSVFHASRVPTGRLTEV